MLPSRCIPSTLRLLRGPRSHSVVASSSKGAPQSLHFSTGMACLQQKRFEGKVALVTASTEGIGLGIAKRLVQDGCAVMINSRKEDKVAAALASLKEDVAGAKVCGLAGNMDKAEDRERLVQETVAQLGGIDFLVSNAGMNLGLGSSLKITESQWDKIFSLNVKSAFFLATRVTPEIIKRGRGSITFISSSVGLVPEQRAGGPYCVSKSALLSVTKVLAEELGRNQIRVNSICPSIVSTKMSKPLLDNPEIMKYMEEQTHLKRLGTVEDVAGLATFLCSDDASYITGENIAITGGKPGRL